MDLVTKIFLEDVGMCDVEPRMQVEVMVDGEPVVMDVKTSMPYEARTRIEQGIHDDRYPLSLEPAEDAYVLSNTFCRYTLRPAKPLQGFYD